jgi:hypothetical protein
MERLVYVAAAYAVVGLGIAAYLAWVRLQAASLRRDVASLRDLLGECPVPDTVAGAARSRGAAPPAV